MAVWGKLNSVSPHWPSQELTMNAQGNKRAVVGRKVVCEVQVNDPHISASHLVIEVVDEDSEGGPRAWLDDKSTNGAFHNGTKIGKGNKVMAVSGDLVSFVVAPTRRHDGSYFVEDKDLKWAAYLLELLPCACEPNRTPARLQNDSAGIAQRNDPSKSELMAIARQMKLKTQAEKICRDVEFRSPVPRGPPQEHALAEAGGSPMPAGANTSPSAPAAPSAVKVVSESGAGREDVTLVFRGEGVDHGGAGARKRRNEHQQEAGDNDEPPEPDWGKFVWDEGDVRRRGATKAEGPEEDAGARAFKLKYELQEKLGDGGYASVHKAVHKESGKAVAVKLIDYQRWKFNHNGISQTQLEAEFNIHANLKHPNVVRMHTVFKGLKYIHVVLEMVSGGDLFDYLIQKAQHGVAEHVACRWMAHLLAGVEYCHSQNVVHRDLKPENILLSHSSERALLKIADFGLAKALTGRGCRTNCGTIQYMAPEVHCMGVPSLEKTMSSYGKEADLWGLGVILHVMLTCTMPFGDDEESQRVVDHLIAQAKGAAAAPDASLMQGSAWQQVSAGAKGLVAGLLTPDASKRFTVQDAWQHAWMKTVDPPDSSQLAVNPLTKKLKWRQKPSDVVVDLR